MGENIVAGRTESGFEFVVDKTAMDDMELLDALADVEAGESLQISVVCDKVLGRAQKRRLYDHLRTEDGRVPIMAVTGAVTEIMKLCGSAGKNS